MKRKKRYIILILFVAVLQSVIAQKQVLQNQPYADQKIFHFGFMVGMHTQDLMLTQSGHVNDNGEVWFTEIPHYSPGFSVGLITDLYLNYYMNLRAIPTLHLGSKDFVFKEQTSGEEFMTGTRNNYITLPLQVKFTTGRVNNYRPYLILGGYGSVELAPRKNRPVLLKSFDYGIEVGVGCDFYLPLFKFSPELKFCFGLADLNETNREDLVDAELMKFPLAISKAMQRMIVISFNFE